MHADGGTQPSLPTRFYLDAEHYERELRCIWYDSWVHLCRSEELPGRGDFRVFPLGSQSILLVRGSDGDLFAYHNTCRHRGSVLCTEDSGRFRGASIVCPYHQWTYSLDGRLRSTPHRLQASGFRTQDYPLYRIAVEQQAGFVFVHLGTDPPPLRESFEPGSAPLENWHLEDLRVGYRTSMRVHCNWKIFWENYHECLHCPSIHPELVKIVPTYGKGVMSEDELSASTMANPDGFAEPSLAAGAVTWTLDGESHLPTLPGLTEQERLRGQSFWTLEPSFFVVAHRDYARRARILPRGVDQTEVQMEWLFPPAVIENDDFDLDHATALGRRVAEQDGQACELNQRGLHALAHERGVLVKQEYSVAGFHDWVRERLQADR